MKKSNTYITCCADEDAHARQVTRLFAHIAPVYDLLNRILSFGFDAFWRRRLVDAALCDLPPGGEIVDLAAGTLEVTRQLATRCPDSPVFGMDFCREMLVRGSPKVCGKSSVALVVADGCRLPLPDDSVSVITVAFGLRNMKPREVALREACRVLKAGGKLCVLEFGSAQDRILFGFYNWYLHTILPGLGRIVSRNKTAYRYLADTITAFPSAHDLALLMKEQGFSEVTFQRYTAGIVCLHVAEK